MEGSYVGSVTTAASVTRTQPNGHSSVVPGIGRMTIGSVSTHGLGGAGSKRPGQRLKAVSERNDSAQSLPSSFTLSGSGLFAQNNNKTR